MLSGPQTLSRNQYTPVSGKITGGGTYGVSGENASRGPDQKSRPSVGSLVCSIRSTWSSGMISSFSFA